MTRRQLEARIRQWQSRLGLAPWEIVVEHADEPTDAWATTKSSPQYRRSTLTFDPALREAGAPKADLIIVHELLHVLMRDVDESFEAVAGQLHPQAVDLAAKRYYHAVEGFVDALAGAIIALPAPPPSAQAGTPAAGSPRAPRRSAPACGPVSRRRA